MDVKEAGKRGGKARALKLSRERRQEIARLGYLASPLSRKREACQSPDNGENKK